MEEPSPWGGPGVVEGLVFPFVYNGTHATGLHPSAWPGPHAQKVLSASHCSPPWCVPPKGFSLVPRLHPSPNSPHVHAHSLGWSSNPVCQQGSGLWGPSCTLLCRGWGVAGSCPSVLLTPGTHGHGCPRVTREIGCSCVPQCEWIAICTSVFHVPWEPVLRLQILVLLFFHKSHAESDPDSMTSFVFSVRTILFKPLGAFDFFFS